MSTLYLIPSLLADDGISFIPPNIKEVLSATRFFIVERHRTARRFIKAIDRSFDLDAVHMIEMNKHADYETQSEVKEWIDEGVDIGLLTEAGCPCIADPGADYVDKARAAGYIIRPLSGPSSIMMGLMASGLNGQQFSFHGYLPINGGELKAKLDQISKEVTRNGYTQIFIETPYRNQATFQKLKELIPSNLRLCIAQNLSSASEKIETKRIMEWTIDFFDGKHPAIFLIGK